MSDDAMIEKVAVAIVNAFNGLGYGGKQRASLEEYQAAGDDVIDICWREPDLRAVARAVIEAMREPTPEMIDAGRVAWLDSATDYNRVDVSNLAAFNAMIDAAGGNHDEATAQMQSPGCVVADGPNGPEFITAPNYARLGFGSIDEAEGRN